MITIAGVRLEQRTALVVGTAGVWTVWAALADGGGPNLGWHDVDWPLTAIDAAALAETLRALPDGTELTIEGEWLMAGGDVVARLAVRWDEGGDDDESEGSAAAMGEDVSERRRAAVDAERRERARRWARATGRVAEDAPEPDADMTLHAASGAAEPEEDEDDPGEPGKEIVS